MTLSIASGYDLASSVSLQVVDAVPLVFSGDFLYLAAVFLVLALLAALVGARGVAGISMEIARILVVIFIILAVVSLIL